MKKLKLIKSIQTKNSPDKCTAEFYQTFKGLQPIFLILFKEIEEALPDSFYEANINLITEPGKDSTEKKTTG